MITARHKCRFTGVAAAVVVLTAGVVSALPVTAQTARPHRTFAQKHPTITAGAAGIGAYALAKKTGKNREQAGRHRNFAQRHPVLTGVATGMVVHHYARKHRR